MAERKDTFAFKVNDTERQMISNLAARLQRTQSDVMRFLVREAARSLETGPADPSSMHSPVSSGSGTG